MPGPSASVSVHTEYTSTPPGCRRSTAASTIARCTAASRSRRVGIDPPPRVGTAT